MSIKRTALALSLALAISALGVATASPDTPEQRLAEMANQGDVQAQFELGHALLVKGDAAAIAWLEKAAQANMAEAHRDLANYYLSQPDSLDNWLHVTEQFRAAATAGDTDATRALALATARRSLSTALSTTERAALALQAATELQQPRYRDDGEAQWHLGVLTLQGLGIPADAQRAFELIQSAAQRKHPAAAYWVARQYLAPTASPAEHLAGERYLEMAARAGHVTAMRELSQRLGPQDPRQADYWAEQARTHQGSLSAVPEASAPAQLVTGAAGAMGGGALALAIAPVATAHVEVSTPITDSLRAENHRLRDALEAANAKIRELVAQLTDAQTTIAKLTQDLQASQTQLAQQQQRAAAPAPRADDRSPAEHNRAGVAAVAARDYGTAAAEFSLAAEGGNAVAEANLGLLQVQGLGVPKDVRAGIARLQHSAGQGNPAAAEALGSIFQYGLEVQADPNQALAWYQHAAALGSESAQQMVVAMGH